MKQLFFFLILFAIYSCNETKEFDTKNLISTPIGWSDEAFKTPPHSGKTQVWHHWLNGHLTKEGITKDLEDMRSKGIGGLRVFNAAEGTPPGSADYFSDEWFEMLIHTKKEADRLGLEVCVMNGPGWATSGGPWNTPENAMQEVVWTEKLVSGPAEFKGKLSIPEPVLGLERDMQRDTFVNKRYYMPRDHVKGHYHDIVLLAFPTPEGERAGNPYRIANWWYKAGYRKMAHYERDTREAPEDEVVYMDEIINLTDKLDSDGNLQWDVPEGDWTILRVGYQPTGRSNHPAPKGGKGLEVDRMSVEAVDIHWKESVMKMLNAGGQEAENSITSITIDSYEAGHQNWTKGFEREFKKKFGYDIHYYLLAVAGRVIESTDVTERFLWDYRKTVSDLIIQNYYKRFQTLAHQNDVSFACEHYGNFGNTDDFSTGKYVDIPTTEFWALKSNHHGGISKLSSSTAHVYGRKIVGAEAFTGAPEKIFETNPRDIKAQGDWMYCRGINQFWLHGYTNNPYEKEPGLVLGSYGSHFNRYNTWWKYSKGWFDYMARCQYMLQQGNPHNDILYFVGEDAPVDPLPKEKLDPAIPDGYDYDFCNRDILESVEVDKGKLVLPNGLEYAVLAVLKSDHLRPEVLKVIEKLLNDGAVVVAYEPTRVPGLSDKEAATEELKGITNQIWDGIDGKTTFKNNSEKGMIYSTESVQDALSDLKIFPDFDFSLESIDQYGETLLPGKGVEFIHRQTDETDVYFVSNQHYKPKTIRAVFRIDNKLPELWDPENGEISIAPEYKKLKDGRMEVTLRMDGAGSVFVVFREPLTKDSASDYKAPQVIDQLTFHTPWQVTFQGSGAPGRIELPELMDISKHENSEVAYFSGTIIYENTLEVDAFPDNMKAILKLGQVEVAAEVLVNDVPVDTLWTLPYSLDITSSLKKGENKIKVKVANLWINRVIGDQELPEDSEWTTNTGSTARGMGLEKIPDWVLEGKDSPTGRKAFVGWKWEHIKGKELSPSGLIGPVYLDFVR